ncbi:hypothetical protein [Segnochrobactrum spirostomi]|uniref:Uncharacterized protein n=1 Tax=Segnochrobactrum spirostomi TaxID=2608987 RepID=A0A6A7Y4W6_9HYPH|nr:hypothetical protein [Segnochrobactrum spirostomi]MQT12772.1 hypothetical protein [Segnochrobactrum spirostomi]
MNAMLIHHLPDFGKGEWAAAPSAPPEAPVFPTHVDPGFQPVAFARDRSGVERVVPASAASAQAPSPAPAALTPVVAPIVGHGAAAVQKAIEEAELRGRLEAIAEARASFEAQRAELEAGFEVRLAETRERWAADQAGVLADGIMAGLAAIESTVLDGLARVLVPVVSASVLQQAQVTLAGLMRRLLEDDEHGTLEVRGPQDLVDNLRARLGESAHSVKFMVDETADVVVTAGDTIIETQLRLWAERLAAAEA